VLYFVANTRLAMIRWLILAVISALVVSNIHAQSFELMGLQETYRGSIGETIRVPVHFKNNSDKTIFLSIKKLSHQIGTSQKNYFCFDNICQDHKTEEYQVKIEPNQTISSLNVVLEAGLAQGVSSVKYLAFNKSNPADAIEFDVNFAVDERALKEAIFTSEWLILHDVYPNPVKDQAVIDYTLLNDQIKAKIVIHNILGNAIEEYPLPYSENKVKIHAEVMNPGVYFYTLYLDNQGFVTRKLIVKK
jgi:hypothetical protein